MGLIYSKLKIFHYKDKLDSLPATTDAILPPIHIRLKPTNLCNHRCSYCAYSEDNMGVFGKTDVQRVFIPKEKVIEIIDDIIEMGVRAVTFSGGGEPLTYQYILDVVKKLADSPVKFATLTNGARLQGEVARLFAERGSWVRVSMDGWDDQSYSEYRRVAHGEYTKIMNNMKNLKSFGGKCYLGVSLIINEQNPTHIYEMLRRLKDVGVDSVKMSPCLVTENVGETNSYHRSFFDRVKAEIARAREDLADLHFEIFDAYTELDAKYAKDYTWCPYLQILPIIGADLNVYTCPDKAYNLDTGVIGSIANQRFRDFWFSGKDKFFKVNPSVHCNHHCEANPKNRLVLDYLNSEPDHLSFV
jgi:MoaA/NifB/PqqE/SkfB family radical SAM enzyme